MRVARDGKQLSQERNAAAAFLALAQTAAATTATAAVTKTTTTVQSQKMKILYWKRKRSLQDFLPLSNHFPAAQNYNSVYMPS